MHSGVRPHLDPTYLRKPKCDLDMHVCACVCVRCLYMHVCVNISSAPHTSGNAHITTHTSKYLWKHLIRQRVSRDWSAQRSFIAYTYGVYSVNDMSYVCFQRVVGCRGSGLNLFSHIIKKTFQQYSPPGTEISLLVCMCTYRNFS